MNELNPIVYNNNRVLTTGQIAEAYETTADRISKNFSANKERYTEGKHYHCLTGNKLKAFKDDFLNSELVKPNASSLYLWTEKGALLHAKSLNTDKAWAVYDELVENYFRVPKAPDLLPLDILAQIAANAAEIDRKQREMDIRQKQIEVAQEKLSINQEKNKRQIQDMRDVIKLDTTSWRKETAKLIKKIAWICRDEYQNVSMCYAEIYAILEHRAGYNLNARVRNKQKRMYEAGQSQNKISSVSKLDVIADDPKLTEIFIAIVKEMAVKHGVGIDTLESIM